MPIPLFGAGLVEAVPDETLLALEDPFDRDRDGISGRAAIVTDVATGQRRVGRFGWKAQIATLLTFSGDAYTNEMGITNDMFPARAARRDLAGAAARMRPGQGSRRLRGPAHRQARDRQLRSVHEVPGADSERPHHR